jgi:hypothetical protein
MFLIRGIGIDSLVAVDGDCPIECEVVGEQVQVRFGSERSTGLTLELSRPSADRLLASVADAITAHAIGDRP